MLDLDKVYTGSCTELMKQIDDNSIDCVISDVPYKISAGGGNNSRR